MKSLSVTVVIPTYKREQPLIDTIGCVLAQNYQADKIIVVDQTLEHTAAVAASLLAFEQEGKIVWLRPKAIDFTSLTKARNKGLQESDTDLVLFIDDDVFFTDDFIAEHVSRFADPSIAATAGRVIVPHHHYPANAPSRIAGVTFMGSFINNFYGLEEMDCEGFVGCNFCLRRSAIDTVGLFDENFIGNAMREETDLAIRIIRSGMRIRFVPSAKVDHLMNPSGGTRAGEKMQWYFAFFHNHFLFYGKHFSIFHQPFFIIHLLRPIFACAIIYGKLRPSAIVVPMRGIFSGLAAARKSKKSGLAMIKRSGNE